MGHHLLLPAQRLPPPGARFAHAPTRMLSPPQLRWSREQPRSQLRYRSQPPRFLRCWSAAPSPSLHPLPPPAPPSPPRGSSCLVQSLAVRHFTVTSLNLTTIHNALTVSLPIQPRQPCLLLSAGLLLPLRC